MPPSAEESDFVWDPPYGDMGDGQLTGVESPFIPQALRPNRERPGDWILNTGATLARALRMPTPPVIGVFMALFAMRAVPCA
jgi:hypothetical protein